PGIVHVPLLEDAVALLVQAAVEIEIDAFGSQRLAKHDAALALRQVGDLGEHMSPEFVVGCSVIDEVEKLLGVGARNIHDCLNPGGRHRQGLCGAESPKKIDNKEISIRTQYNHKSTRCPAPHPCG